MTVISLTDQALWESLLGATTDGDGEPLDRHYRIANVDPGAAHRLNAAFYLWKEQADAVMIRHGFGDLCLEDLLGADRVEDCYVLVRDGHGVGMTDRWLSDSPEWACCWELENLAAAQGEISAYVGDDGRIYTL